MDDPDFFLPAAAASRAGVPELEIHAAIDRGELRTVVYRGEIRIPAESLRAFHATTICLRRPTPVAGK
jgi:hypothetical protein